MSERLIGLRLVDSDDGRTWLEYRLVDGVAVPVVGSDMWRARIAEGGITLCGAALIAARGFGLRLGIEVGEGPYFPRDGERFLAALVGDRLTHTGSRVEPITEDPLDPRGHGHRPQRGGSNGIGC